MVIGTNVGPYRVLEKLGEGGMGEVYRARDTKLDRDVAIKILPELFAADPERVARFTREAHVLGALNHPHIAQIHGLEDAHGISALVMELVEGPTLADPRGARCGWPGLVSEAEAPAGTSVALRLAPLMAGPEIERGDDARKQRHPAQHHVHAKHQSSLVARATAQPRKNIQTAPPAIASPQGKRLLAQELAEQQRASGDVRSVRQLVDQHAPLPPFQF